MPSPVEIIYYTDPMCCWSFVMEEAWQNFKQNIGSSVRVRYCMSGLLPSWNQFNDPVSMVTKPIQMGPVWMEASVISGIKLADTIWFHDPPESSYLACLAVKAASCQSPEAEESMLLHLRINLMKKGINIAKASAINNIAVELSQEIQFDVEKFQTDLESDLCISDFKKDLDEVAVYNITRFPSIMVKWDNGKRSMISGYRRKEELMKILEGV